MMMMMITKTGVNKIRVNLKFDAAVLPSILIVIFIGKQVEVVVVVHFLVMLMIKVNRWWWHVATRQ